MKKFGMLQMLLTVLLALSLVTVPSNAMAAVKKRTTTTTLAATPSVEATWVWNTFHIVYEKDELLQFAKANGVNLIYLQILQDGEITPDQYRTFIREAAQNGIQVHALHGGSEWVLAENRYHITDLINWVKQYNLTAASNERFTGIHLDVEPYILPEWSTNQDAIVTAWVDTVKMFITQARRADSTLQLGSDIPAWLEYVNIPKKGGKLSTFMISQYDHVTLMAYRDFAQGPNGVIEIVQNEIAQANQLGKKVIVGVNTIVGDAEGDMVTFAEEGNAFMESQIALIHSALKGNASFAGHAVHDYTSWKNAQP